MILNKQISEKNFLIYNDILSSSIISNICCILYIQKQNKQFNKLVRKNKSFVTSIDKLNAGYS